jgi:3-oxoadipate enol-lactonase
MGYTNGSGGCRIWYEERGSGDPLLLIPGQASDHRMWDDVRQTLERRHRVLVFDHRGTGKSDAPLEPPYSIEMFASDAIAVLDTAGIRRAHVYGISMGGRIAQRIAISYPDRVGSVVLGATTLGDLHGVQRSPEVARKFQAAEPADKFRMLIDELYSPAFQAAHPEAVQRFRELVVGEPTPPESLRLHYQASQARRGMNCRRSPPQFW